MNLRERRCWIFDMDGTLTVAMHDFATMRLALGLPPDQPILEGIAARPPEEAAVLRQRLEQIEVEIALAAVARPGAHDLLAGLARQGARLGILTRNSLQNARITLRACGLLDFFKPACILGREAAAPKPDPDGILRLLAHWQARPEEAVMVGDGLFDVQAGRRAGAATVYIGLDGDGRWAEHADVRVANLSDLLDLAKAA